MPAHLRELFGDTVGELRATLQTFCFRYRSPEHFIEVLRTWYGPTHKAYAALPADGAATLECDITDLLQRLNLAGGRSLVVPSEYLEAVITRR